MIKRLVLSAVATLGLGVAALSAGQDAPKPPGDPTQSPPEKSVGIYVAPKYKLGTYPLNIAYYEGSELVHAVYINGVVADTPAAKIGLEHGDIITRIDGNRVRNTGEYTGLINKSNGSIALRVKDSRTGKYQDFNGIKLEAAEQPDDGPDQRP